MLETLSQFNKYSGKIKQYSIRKYYNLYSGKKELRLLLELKKNEKFLMFNPLFFDEYHKLATIFVCKGADTDLFEHSRLRNWRYKWN